MNHQPKVSIICLCHNQVDYVKASITSALDQSYANTELILVDDGSTDGSKEIMREIARQHQLQFIDIAVSKGNCKAFNRGFQASSGGYLIDLAADDLLYPQRIEEGLKTFFAQSIGVEFCNVLHVDKAGNPLHPHFDSDSAVPVGDVYQNLISTYFISPPGMMIKRDVMTELGGYDETLSYEDFDFWIRSSRNHPYGYTNQVLVKKREVPHSLSKKQFRMLNSHQRSTLEVCKKIKGLNRTADEEKSLRKRCFYEVRNCIRQGNLGLIPEFLMLAF